MNSVIRYAFGFLCALAAFSGTLAYAQETTTEENITDLEIDQALTPYGDWVEGTKFGRVWRPRGLSNNWRPYSRGEWIKLSTGAWSWRSYLKWGRIPFHYGRWIELNRYGWVWVPGYLYSPAWVVWTDDSDFVGWAPLPPGAGWSRGLFLGTIPRRTWIYCPQSLFVRPIVRFYPRYYGPRGRLPIYRSYHGRYRGKFKPGVFSGRRGRKGRFGRPNARRKRGYRNSPRKGQGYNKKRTRGSRTYTSSSRSPGSNRTTRSNLQSGSGKQQTTKSRKNYSGKTRSNKGYFKSRSSKGRSIKSFSRKRFRGGGRSRK